MFPFLSKHKCSHIEQTLSFLFLPSNSYPSPTRTSYLKNGTNICRLFRWDRTHSSMLLSNFKFQSSSLTTRPVVVIIHSTRSLTVKRSGFQLQFLRGTLSIIRWLVYQNALCNHRITDIFPLKNRNTLIYS